MTESHSDAKLAMMLQNINMNGIALTGIWCPEIIHLMWLFDETSI